MDNPNSNLTSTATKHMNALEAWMAPLFAKAPHLSVSIRQTLVSIAPWVALIVGVMGVLGIFSILSFLPMLASIPSMMIAGMGNLYPMMIVTTLVGGIAAVLDLLAFKPLKAKKKKGWSLLFYGNTLSALSAILSLIFGYSGGLGSLIGVIIGFWLLFEVREMYQE